MTDATLTAVYELHGGDAERRAHALAVEQSHELPTELAPEHTRRSSLARVVALDEPRDDYALATIEYPAALAGDELPQLLVLLLGNGSLQEGVRIVDVDLPTDLLSRFPGPRLGVEGVRARVRAEGRPLLATALKPVGLSVVELASLAYELAAGGIDIVKDDQGLANQHWAPFSERVQRVSEAVARANADTGGSAVYLPAVNPPVDRFEGRLAEVRSAGAGGALIVPGVGGFDQLRRAGEVLDGVVLAHPSFLGGFTASREHGIAPDVLFGLLLRIAGADAAIFPSWGGRFSFTREECERIAARSAAPLDGIAPILPAPGGGMTVERVPELVDAYGRDVLLLIGADLQRGGDPRAAAERFRAAAESV